MSFALRFADNIRKRGPTLPRQLLWHTGWVSFSVFLFSFWYLSITEPGSALVTVNKALADTAVILIGCSFALSGLCYFWNFFDTKIIYRKYLGISGFAFGLAHGVISLIFYLYLKPHGYETSPIFMLDHQWNFGSFFIPNLYAFASGLVALCIFAMMAAISNQYAIHELGGVWWRRLLRLGYLAYIFAAFHFLVKNIPDWLMMSMTPEQGLPPLNMVLSLLVLSVIVLRLTLWYSLWKKSHQAPPAPVPVTEKEGGTSE